MKKVLALIAGVFAASGVMAAGPDMTSLTTAIDFGTVTTAILAAAAALIVVYVAFKGAKLVIAAVRGA